MLTTFLLTRLLISLYLDPIVNLLITRAKMLFSLRTPKLKKKNLKLKMKLNDSPLPPAHKWTLLLNARIPLLKPIALPRKSKSLSGPPWILETDLLHCVLALLVPFLTLCPP